MQSRRLLKIIEKHFEGCKTFQDLSNFRKVILDLLAINLTFKNHRKVFWSLQDIWELAKLQKSYLGPSGNPGDLKIIEKYFETCKMFQDFSNFKKVTLDFLAIQENFKNHRKVFWSLQDIWELAKLQKSYLRPFGNPGDF